MPGPQAEDTTDELLRYIRLRPDPFATAGDIEPKTSVGYKQTRNRLDDLVEEGYLHSRKVGNVLVYWLSDKGEEQLADSY